MNNPVAKSGDLRIETLRGLAIVGVVGNHVILWLLWALSTRDGAGDSFTLLLNEASDFITPLRMPLFTLLSGWVYALNPVTAGGIWPFLQGKLRRIILPLFTLSTLMYFCAYFTMDTLPVTHGNPPVPVAPNEFWLTWFYHYGHFWFLHALTIIFVIVMVIDRFGLMNNMFMWFVWIALSALVYRYVPGWIELWSFTHMKEILIFFMIGVGLCRFRETIFAFKWWPLSGVAVLAAMIANQMSTHSYWSITVFIGALAPVFFLSLNMSWRPFVWLGQYSYTIYLYHGIVLTLLTPLLWQIVEVQWLWLGVMLAASLLLPVAIDRAVEKIPVIRAPLLGRRFF